MDKTQVAIVVTNILREAQVIGGCDYISVANTDLLGDVITKNVRNGYKVEVQISPTDDFTFVEYKDDKVVFTGYSKIKTFKKVTKDIGESLAEMLL
mgnify:FL=1